MLFTGQDTRYIYDAVSVHFDSTKQYHTHRINIARSLTRLSSKSFVVDPPLSLSNHNRQYINSNGRIPLPLKASYTVCLWQPYFWLTDTYSALIKDNKQLSLLTNDKLYEAAAQADILLFSSGGNFSVNDILEQIDLSNKYVIIISTYCEQEIRAHVQYRIDHYQNAYLIASQSEFDQFISTMLDKATKAD